MGILSSFRRVSELHGARKSRTPNHRTRLDKEMASNEGSAGKWEVVKKGKKSSNSGGEKRAGSGGRRALGESNQEADRRKSGRPALSANL